MKKLTKQSKIVYVEHPPTQFGEYNGEMGFCVFDRFGLIPSRATHTLEAITKNAGFKNVRSINPLFHGTERKDVKTGVFMSNLGKDEGKFSKRLEKEMFSHDLIGGSAITRTSKQTMELFKRYKYLNPDGITLAGGPDATFRFEDYLTKGNTDIVVIKEAENTLPELLNRLRETTTELEDINGIAFLKNGEVIVTPERRLLTAKELSEVPHPIYDSDVRSYANIAVMETTRGCPHACNFCTVTKFNGRKYRLKSIDYVLEGLRNIQDLGGTLFMTDDNLAANPKRTINLLKAIRKAGLSRKRECG